MRNRILAATLVLATIAAPAAGRAQVVNGAARGADQGEAVGGPLGGVVGGALGAGVGAATGVLGTATGIVDGVLGVDERPRFRDFVIRERHPSFRFRDPLRVGVVLPRSGVTYYDVPAEYRARPGYRYTIVNERPVLVDPRTRRVVEVVE